jgi:hypothetical protein
MSSPDSKAFWTARQGCRESVFRVFEPLLDASWSAPALKKIIKDINRLCFKAFSLSERHPSIRGNSPLRRQ